MQVKKGQPGQNGSPGRKEAGGGGGGWGGGGWCTRREAAGQTGGRNDHSTLGKTRITEESVTADTARGQPGESTEEILQVPG